MTAMESLMPRFALHATPLAFVGEINPLLFWLVGGAAVLIGGALLGRVYASWKERRRLTKRRAAAARAQQITAEQEAEQQRLVNKIIATSSTGEIAGFTIKRQIEAVFSDGHPSPQHAIDMLKAIAARKGANAIINVASGRVGGGKCVAQGDAVIVRADDDPSPSHGPVES